MQAIEAAKKPLVPGSPNFIVTSPEISAMEALGIMKNYKIHHLVVLGRHNERAVISDRDLISHSIAEGKLNQLAAVKVGEVAHFHAPTVSETTDLCEVIKIMEEEDVSAVLIMTGNTLSAILTESDLFRAMRNLHSIRKPTEEPLAKGDYILSCSTAQSFMNMISEMGN